MGTWTQREWGRGYRRGVPCGRPACPRESGGWIAPTDMVLEADMTTLEYIENPTSAFQGIYDAPEAARYLRADRYGDKVYSVSSATLTRWIRRGISTPEFVDIPGKELLIGFEDLVSLRVVAALRAAGVGWMEIDRTEKWLRKETEHPRPFATEYLWAGQGQIYADWTRRLISASRSGQMALDMLKEYLIPIHGLEFSETTRLAKSWEPTDGIVLQPQVQFGAPCIKDTRIPTRSIFGMIEAGDSIEFAARAYGISQEEVRGAYDWESRLRAS